MSSNEGLQRVFYLQAVLAADVEHQVRVDADPHRRCRHPFVWRPSSICSSSARRSTSWKLGRERRAAAREARRARGQHVGRPKALDEKETGLDLRMHVSGESASTIAGALGLSRATVYRVLAQKAE